jgi:TolB protein
LFVSQFLPFFDQYALSHRLWSPDSSALVLPARVEGASQIMLFPADGGEPRPVAPGSMAFWSHE